MDNKENTSSEWQVNVLLPLISCHKTAKVAQTL
jgi:hypothetical protein